MSGEGLAERNALIGAGFTPLEVQQWEAEQRDVLSSAGFSPAEVDEYFGVAPFDSERVATAIQENLAATPEAATDFVSALDAGFQTSVSGLLARQKAPQSYVPEGAGIGLRLTSSVATLAGDAPFMLAGALIGGSGGAPTGPGAVLTAAGAAFALPAGMRQILMDEYEKGSVNTMGDFVERAWDAIVESTKGYIVGATTSGAGLATKAALPATAPVAAKALLPTSAEVGTMVSVQSALEGEVPTAESFLDAAILLFGMKASVSGAAKLRKIYAETGVRPEEVAQQAKNDPVLRQELASKNVEVPESIAVAGQMRGIPRAEAKPAPEPPAPAPRKPKTDIEKAQAEVSNQIVTQPSKRELPTADEVYTALVNDFHPLSVAAQKLTGRRAKDIPVAENPEALAQLSRGSVGKADQFLENSTFKFSTLEDVGPGLRKILKPVGKDIDGFRSYAVSRRALELNERGIESGIAPKSAQAVVDAGKGKYEKTFQEIVKYQDDLLFYLRDAGLIKPEVVKLMQEANRSYVPFTRLFEPEKKGAGMGRGLGVNQPIRRIKGSERKVVDPIESIVRNTYLIHSLADRNAVGNQFLKLIRENPQRAADLGIKELPTPKKPVNISEAEVAKFMKENGIEGDAAAFSVFRPKGFQPSETQIRVFENGVERLIEVPKDLGNAFNAMNRESINWLVQMAAVPAKALRAGVVLSPDFMARNLSRDQLSAFVLSKHGFIPVVDMVRGIASIAKQDKVFQDWLKSGGGQSAFISMDRQYLQTKVFQLTKETGVATRAWNVITSPIEGLRVVGELVENASRVGEFGRAVRGKSGKAALQEGGMASKEVVVNFARRGAKTDALRKIVAFFGAHVQGLDRTARAFKDNPIETTTKVAAAVTLPSMMLWWANKDDPRYYEVPQWQRDLFWIVPTDDWQPASEFEASSVAEYLRRQTPDGWEINTGVVYRIPKPFELGIIFGSLPERLLDGFYNDNPDAFKEFENTLISAFVPNMVPQAVSPVIEQVTNYNLFTKSPLVPAYLEREMPEYQYTDYTTQSAQALGSLLSEFPGMDFSTSASPMVIENYIRGWTGTLGMYALKTADKALQQAGVFPDPVKPEDTLADVPVVKAFVVRYPSAGAEPIKNFYEQFKKSQKAYTSYMSRLELDDSEEAQAIIDKYPNALVQLTGVRNALGTQSRLIRSINKNPDITPEEKRQLIDSTYFRMIELAGYGNEVMADIDKAIKAEGNQ